MIEEVYIDVNGKMGPKTKYMVMSMSRAKAVLGSHGYWKDSFATNPVDMIAEYAVILDDNYCIEYGSTLSHAMEKLYKFTTKGEPEDES